jgi:2-hydroxy-3-keto-5-methylthiopentenyl-1-phosphate phosphatase
MNFPRVSNQLASLPIAVFSDFDGTIAHPDTLNFLTERFAGNEFRRRIGRKIASGEMSLREGIRLEVASIRGDLDEVLRILRHHVMVDPQFPAFADWCHGQGIPLTVLSAGMKEVVESLLAPCKLKSVKIVANPLRIENGKWSLQFIDETPWGHDKSRDVLKAKADGYFTVFLGDGLSDRSAAQSADLVFAKDGLARHCQEQGIPFVAFSDFSDVQKDLTARIG